MIPPYLRGLFALPLSLAACAVASPPPAPEPVAVAAPAPSPVVASAPRQSRACRWRAVERAPRSAFAETAFTMRVRSDSGPCVMTLRLRIESPITSQVPMQYTGGAVAQEPQHGQVTLNFDDQSTVAYLPAPGYVGPDSFAFRMLPGNGLRTVTVRVTKG